MKKELAFPVIAKDLPHCSICENPNVYFQCTDKWVEKVQFQGTLYLVHQFLVKKYCKDCFAEYGGSEVAYGHR